MKMGFYVIIILLLCSGTLLAQEFTVGDIRVQGLKRVSLGTVLTALPVRIGEKFDVSETTDLVKTLYKTGLFDDIVISRQGNILRIRVVERPGIAEIQFEGNRHATEEQLIDALKSGGVAVGKIFDRAVVARLEEELIQQYYAIGKYDTKIEVKTHALKGRRISIHVKIEESEIAAIKRVRIFGNTAIDEGELRKAVDLGPRDWYDFWSTKDQYSRLKFSAGLEAIRNLYLDRGYLDFDVENTQVE